MAMEEKAPDLVLDIEVRGWASEQDIRNPNL